MPIKKEKINNFKVRPIKLKKDTRPVKGAEIYNRPFMNMYILGKKHLGKTNIIFNVLCKRIEVNTTLVIFSSTIFCDDSWLAIKQFFEKKHVPMQCYDSIYANGVNQLQSLIEHISAEAQAREEEERVKKQDKKKGKKKLPKVVVYNDSDDEEEERERKPKTIASDYIIVLDDLSDEIKDVTLTALMKKHRHLKSSIIVANQSLNDLAVSARKQLDVWVLLKDIGEKKMLEIYERCSLPVDFPKFLTMYEDATAEPYNFFYFNTNINDLRHNFDKRYKV